LDPKLEDDEYELIWENLNTNKRLSGEKRWRRLKKDLEKVSIDKVDKDMWSLKLEEQKEDEDDFIDDVKEE